MLKYDKSRESEREQQGIYPGILTGDFRHHLQVLLAKTITRVIPRVLRAVVVEVLHYLVFSSCSPPQLSLYLFIHVLK
jgi:hypothetical protein